MDMAASSEDENEGTCLPNPETGTTSWEHEGEQSLSVLPSKTVSSKLKKKSTTRRISSVFVKKVEQVLPEELTSREKSHQKSSSGTSGVGTGGGGGVGADAETDLTSTSSEVVEKGEGNSLGESSESLGKEKGDKRVTETTDGGKEKEAIGVSYVGASTGVVVTGGGITGRKLRNRRVPGSGITGSYGTSVDDGEGSVGGSCSVTEVSERRVSRTHRKEKEGTEKPKLDLRTKDKDKRKKEVINTQSPRIKIKG
eukprot:TRINITY_DN7924_c0_g2_i4.p1 TRINITY_DN7924_c0_g2~~TRINITY_DN7924_c0_g2_i4.p1  ORF type:complete len:254 (+),score=83.50 TRINITY_DN7924_c0_g2_i4:394-1155(+)